MFSQDSFSASKEPQQPLAIPTAQGPVFAPVRAFVPQDILSDLPPEFLDAAIVTSHGDHAELEATFPGVFANTYIILL